MNTAVKAPGRLTVAHVDAETKFSGGEVQVFLLMEGLRRRGHRCVLIAPPGSCAEAEAHARGLEVCVVKMRSDLDFMSVLMLRKALDTIVPDVVHLHTGRATWLGGLAAHLAHRPAITTRRMDRRVKRGWRTTLVYGSLVARAAAVSSAVARCLEDGGVDQARTVLVHDAIDPQRVAIRAGRCATRTSLGAGQDALVVLSLAALVPRKGLDVLIDALGTLDARGVCPQAWIAGEGSEHASLERKISALSLKGRVHLLGRREDTGDLLAGCDIFALPSRREGLGVAALEAMAAGKPVVASRVGGLAEVVAHGRTGVLVLKQAPLPL